MNKINPEKFFSYRITRTQWTKPETPVKAWLLLSLRGFVHPYHYKQNTFDGQNYQTQKWTKPPAKTTGWVLFIYHVAAQGFKHRRLRRCKTRAFKPLSLTPKPNNHFYNQPFMMVNVLSVGVLAGVKARAFTSLSSLQRVAKILQRDTYTDMIWWLLILVFTRRRLRRRRSKGVYALVL